MMGKVKDFYWDKINELASTNEGEYNYELMSELAEEFLDIMEQDMYSMSDIEIIPN